MHQEAVEILLVEDNEADIELTREALRQGRILNNLHVVRNGDEALASLRMEAPDAPPTLPDLVLLDLNLPGTTGHEVLAEMKQDPKLATIPVVILTTSSADRDILSTYQMHANSFVTKPVDFDSFLRVVKEITDYWFSVVKLPRHHA